MLDAGLKSQLKTYLQNVREPVVLAASLDDTASSTELMTLLDEIAEQCERVSVIRRDDDARRPSFAIERPGTDISVRFAGLPLGHEFTSLVLALLWVGGHPPKVEAELLDQIRALDGDFRFETYYALSCQNCPDVVQALTLMSVVNPRIRHVAIDGALFREEVERRQVLAVPTVRLNDAPFAQGRMSLEQILAALDAGAEARAAERIRGKAPFDVLVVGAGPAGAAAAVYAARKGVRTGLAAERFGGQVLDTLGIENLIAVPHAEGPQLAAALERNAREQGVDVMALQSAVGLVPATEPGGLAEVRLASGASLWSRTVVLAPGARWRTLGVPGEDAYRNRGVAFCPHCDGPLFKGRRVAVVGGGNSGVEAAIDLAGLAADVTLIEFDDKLRADAVLRDALARLPNVRVVTSARTTEVIGDGERVTGLAYVDRTDGSAHALALDGVFVQIGLEPNTEWLAGAVALTARGEIEVDARGATSAPGIYAAGDATTAPYKQIVIALGDGARAALSAFDDLIRQPAAQPQRAAA